MREQNTCLKEYQRNIMKLRNSDKYKSPNARTARMERSAISNMINHPNLKHKEQNAIQEKKNIKEKHPVDMNLCVPVNFSLFA